MRLKLGIAAFLLFIGLISFLLNRPAQQYVTVTSPIHRSEDPSMNGEIPDFYKSLLRPDQFEIAYELARTGNFSFYRFLLNVAVVEGIACTDYKDMLLTDIDANMLSKMSMPYKDVNSFLDERKEISSNALEFNLTMYLHPNFPYRAKCSLKTDGPSDKRKVPDYILRIAERVKQKMDVALKNK